LPAAATAVAVAVTLLAPATPSLAAATLALATPSHAATAATTATATAAADAKPAVRKCTLENPLTIKEARVLVGLKQRKARELAQDVYKWGWRVGERDGEMFVGTADYRPCRVSVAINNGRVTKILQVG
jgi:hypothetical protein